jgi:calcium-dependent protein kinase
MKGLLEGLAHMHENRIMHRDLKPENIMFRDENSMDPVIVDFGLATNADLPKYLFYRCGTPGYVALKLFPLLKIFMSNLSATFFQQESFSIFFC